MPQVADDSGPDPSKGPVQSRGCTDVLFLLAFILFWIGMVIVAQQAFADGDPARLIAPFDSDGRRCGYGEVSGLRNLYFPSPATPLAMCVDKCPGSGSDRADYFSGLSIAEQLIAIPFPGELINNTGALFCDGSDVVCAPNFSLRESRDNLLSGNYTAELARCFCPYETTNILRRCSPPLDSITDANATETLGELGSLVNADLADSSTASEIFSDFEAAWWIFPAAVGIAVVGGFVWLVLLRMFAGIMVWASILAVEVALILLGWYLYTNGDDLASEADSSTEVVGGGAGTNADIMLYCSYAVFAIAGILLLIIIFMFNKIRLAIAVIKVAAKAMAAMPSIVLFPIIPFVLLAAFLAYWVAVAVYLASVEDDSGGKTDEEAAKSAQDLQYLQLYHLFGFFWTTQFILAIGMLTVAGAIASWYWAPEPKSKNMPTAPVMSAFFRTVRYHLGTAAFGALIIAIVQFVRAILRYMESKLKGKDNKFLKFLFCCLQCCFACVERFLKFVSRNAYIMTASTGKNFCGAARAAFNIILSNIMRVAAVSVVSDFVLFLGKLFIAALTAFVCMTILQGQDNLYYWSVPTILCLIIAYFIAEVFLSVFQLAIDTILLSALQDLEMNDGSAKPYSFPDEIGGLLS